MPACMSMWKACSILHTSADSCEPRDRAIVIQHLLQRRDLSRRATRGTLGNFSYWVLAGGQYAVLNFAGAPSH